MEKKTTEWTPTKDQAKAPYGAPGQEIAKQSPNKPSSLNNLQMTVDSFINQTDTQLRAALYSVSCEDLQEVHKTML